jgi:ubiquinone/menaquinone biosynthesis C-methylase UbiE
VIMSMSQNPRKEHPSTYFVQDRSSQDEMKRLQIQGSMHTAAMGGVFPEQPNPASFQRVLDVGCGTGSWVIEAAKTYPSISYLVGVDISNKMIEYARNQVMVEQVSERVEFRTMDALRMLEFPTGYFDLVNQRSAVSWLRTWDWPKLLEEYQRVTRSGGVVRITESDWLGETNSPALSQITEIWLKAFHRAGHSFTPDSDGVISMLSGLLSQHGLENVQSRAFSIEYRAGTPLGENLYKDLELAFRTILPFLRKWVRLPDDYENICQQALNEMQQPDFVVVARMLTAWGTTPLVQSSGSGFAN